MVNSTILMISGDPALLESVRHDLKALGGVSRIDLVATVQDACDLLSKIQPRLILADWKRKQNGFESMDRLLWTSSKLTRHTPVVVVTDHYREEQAVTFYRMGVSDYISKSDHLSSLRQILEAYLTPSSSSSCEFPVYNEENYPRPEARKDSHKESVPPGSPATYQASNS